MGLSPPFILEDAAGHDLYPVTVFGAGAGCSVPFICSMTEYKGTRHYVFDFDAGYWDLCAISTPTIYAHVCLDLLC